MRIQQKSVHFGMEHGSAQRAEPPRRDADWLRQRQLIARSGCRNRRPSRVQHLPGRFRPLRRSPTDQTPNCKVPKLNAEPGSPEALLMQIAALIAQTNADLERTQSLEGGGIGNADPAAAAFRRRLEQIVDLATQVIALTHLDPASEQSFNNAVHYLSDARLELASAGEAAQAGLLIDDANSLYERDKQSFAAAESGSKVVELAERMARNLGSDDPEWLTEYAVQARQFADRFPHEPSRSAMALFNAGRLCDRFNMTESARQCLQQVQTQFPETIFAEQSAGILRRLSLQGQTIELTGPTIDGGFVEIEQYTGKPVLVVFWSTTSPTFLEQLPNLKQIEARYAATGLTIIGVNLDTDEASVDRFLTEQKLAWRQVFSVDPAQRGGRNPVARTTESRSCRPTGLSTETALWSTTARPSMLCQQRSSVLSASNDVCCTAVRLDPYLLCARKYTTLRVSATV